MSVKTNLFRFRDRVNGGIRIKTALGRLYSTAMGFKKDAGMAYGVLNTIYKQETTKHSQHKKMMQGSGEEGFDKRRKNYGIAWRRLGRHAAGR